MAINPVLSALLNSFAVTQGLEKRSEAEKFEHFVNYTILAQEFSEEFDFLSIATGEQEFGIDGIAFLVNGALISNLDAAQDCIKFNKFLNCDIFFIQSKTSNKFESGEILKLFEAVSDFFNDRPPALSQGSEVLEKWEVKNEIYKNAQLFTQRLPRLHVCYASLGKWQNDKNLVSIVKTQIEKLVERALFDEILFKPIDAQTLQKIYYMLQQASSTTIDFPASLALPEIPQVTEAYIGVVNSLEYLKLISDEEGQFKPSIFSDNVRDVQSSSEVNKEIDKTLKSDRRLEFPLRNNGITVVCRELRRVGTKFTLEDYQVVNGCQTSNVLFANTASLQKELVLSLKIICTRDEDVTNSIIRGSNRQNEVSSTQFWALEPIHKQIEIFFDQVFAGDPKLFYERRRGQYAKNPEVEKVRIVSPESLLQSYAAMIIDEPHQVSKYYTGLLPLVGKSIFNDSHNLYTYHASAYVLFKLEQLFRNAYVPFSSRKFRFMFAMCIKYIVLDKIKIDVNGKYAEAHAAKLVAFVQKTTDLTALCEEVVAYIREIMPKIGIEEERQAAKSASLRNELRSKYSKISA